MSKTATLNLRYRVILIYAASKNSKVTMPLTIKFLIFVDWVKF